MLAWTAHEQTHMKQTRLNTMQLQHFCELSGCSACVLHLVSYQQQYHIWAKEVLVLVYPKELGSFIGHTAEDFLPGSAHFK